jgi:hypothetical protein
MGTRVAISTGRLPKPGSKHPRLLSRTVDGVNWLLGASS